MPYPIDRKLVVAVSSTALFDLDKEDTIYRNDGIVAYREYQERNKNIILEKGISFPFIRRFLNINKIYSAEKPVEVVLLSKNSPEIGLRVFKSIKKHNLDISRAVFTSGASPYKYIPAFNVSLFLSTDLEDVAEAICQGFPAGRVLKSKFLDEEDDNELRVAFDFDGVIADDESESVYSESNNLELFHNYEVKNIDIPHKSGPLLDFFKKLSFFQKLECKKLEENKGYKKIIKTAIVTARNAPAHERAINTLKSWHVTVDEMFLMGGIEKKRVLEIFKPQLYIDDQMQHLTDIRNIPLVHIPFGIKNSNKGYTSLPKDEIKK